MHVLAPPREIKPRHRRPQGNATPDTALQLSTGRVRDIAALRGLGFSFREIADHFHVTPQAAALLLARNRRNIAAIGGMPAMAGLSTRAVAALRRLGVNSPEDATRRDVLAELRSARNCGAKTLDEIASWMVSAGRRA